MNEFLLKNFHWFKQGAMRIVFDPFVIYTDPFGIDKEYRDADYIFFTHSHGDHFSPEDIAKVIKDETVLIFPSEMKSIVCEKYDNMCVEVNVGDTLEFESFAVEAVAAYNIVKTQCHAKEKGWVGYVFSNEDTALYYTGDTELIPEMNDIKADIICLPMGQKFTFGKVEDAAEAVKRTNASTAVPIHYGMFEGSLEDIEKFTGLVEQYCEVYCQK